MNKVLDGLGNWDGVSYWYDHCHVQCEGPGSRATPPEDCVWTEGSRLLKIADAI